VPGSVKLPLQFPDPPTRLTTREALPGNPYAAGLHLLDRPRGPINLDAFGLAWQITGVPIGVGRRVTGVTTYDRVLLELLEIPIDLTGATSNGPLRQVDQDEGRFYFSEFPIERISAWIYPFCSANFWWILVL
jgi:hypothetical protein